MTAIRPFCDIDSRGQADHTLMKSAGERDMSMSSNFGDFQLGVYADAVKGVNSRYPSDFRSIERKASEALPDWVYRYVSAAAGDGRTQQANIDAYSHYGIIPRMMVSPPERDLSIDLFAKHFESPIFMCPIGLVGLCSPDFQGDVAAARASAATGVPFTLSTRQTPSSPWRWEQQPSGSADPTHTPCPTAAPKA
jgi:hypothetical protein